MAESKNYTVLVKQPKDYTALKNHKALVKKSKDDSVLLKEQQAVSLSTIIYITLFILISVIFIILLKYFYRNRKPVRLSSRSKPKKPYLSAIFSLIIPGLGQLYNGEIKRAIIYLSVFVFSASCAAFFYFLVFIHSIVAILPALLGSSLLLFSHIHCVIDGYKISKLINLHISKIDDLKTNDVGEKIKTSLSLFTSRNYEPALYSLTRIVESNPNDSKVYYNRGVMYYKLGDYANAKKDIITAARLGHEKSKHILEVYNIDY